MKTPPFVVLLACAAITGCTGWSPSRPFERDAPAVRTAIDALDAGDAAAAAEHLEEYLSTGPCKDGNIGAPESIKQRMNGTFDLGLSLFRLGEQFGRRFGEEEDGPGTTSEASKAERHAYIVCARLLLQAVAESPEASAELRARAHYLDGNLAFLDGAYEEAVRAYDGALVLAPGTVDGGDAIGRDAAWNRAIALRRIDDKKDAGSDASQDASRDASADGAAGDRDAADSARDGGQDAAAGAQEGGTDHEGEDAAPPPPPDEDAGDRDAAPPPSSASQDERILEQLENAPSLQQEANRRARHRVRTGVDK